MNDLNQLDQDDWVQRLQPESKDRESAIEDLRSYLVRGLSRSLVHRYGGKVQVEDVVQVALLKILDSLHTFESRSRFETWALSIATRIGISELRRRYYKDVSLDQTLGSDWFRVDLSDSESNSIEKRESRQRILILLQKLIEDTLSQKQKIVIRGTLEGLPVEEIALRLSSNRNAVYKLVHDARLKLRKQFEVYGVTSDDISLFLS